MKKRLISIMLCAVMLSVEILSQKFGIVYAEMYDFFFDYTIVALSSDDDAFILNSPSGCINGNVASNSSFDLKSVYLNGKKTENIGISYIDLSDAINDKYFNQYNVCNSSSDCGENINGAVEFTNDVTFDNGINLNGALKSHGDIVVSGTINVNNGCIVTENGNITIETDNISLSGLIYAPNGVLTINGWNVNLNNVCIIADKINISSRYSVNINLNHELLSFVRENAVFSEEYNSSDEGENENISSINPYEDLYFGDITQFVYASANVVNDSVEIYWFTNVNSESTKIYEIVDDKKFFLAEVSNDNKYMYQRSGDLPESIIVVERAGIYSYPLRLYVSSEIIQVELEDLDNDGLNDAIETIISTDIDNEDTDLDGLSDYYEIIELGTNPLSPDTDNDGVNDLNDDIDCDGIINLDELSYGTNPFLSDSDDDNLSDWDEIFRFFTNPVLSDTDNDGASDEFEIDNGYDPLTPNLSFVIEKSYGEVSLANPVCPSVKVELFNGDIESLIIEKVKPHDNPFITPSIAGIMGDAFSFDVDAHIQSAELIFNYDVELYGILSDDFQPRIYYFNEEYKVFEELENQIVENGIIKAVTTHFSTYVLLNKIDYDKAWKDFDISTSYNATESNSLGILTIYETYSNVSQSTVDKYVHFQEILGYKVYEESSHYTENGLIGTSWASVGYGGDSHGQSLVNDLKIFEEKRDVLNSFDNRLIIIFVNGAHKKISGYEEFYDCLEKFAQDNNVNIYIISLSDSEKDYLSNIAIRNGGNYYSYSEQGIQDLIDQIPFKDIRSNSNSDKLSDSNNDGISDYYTEMIKNGTLLLSNSSNELMYIDFNYDCNGFFSDDWDGDGLKNGDEIQVVTRYGKTYLVMNSHPLRAYSDADLYSDYEEFINGTDSFTYNINRVDVDYLTNDAIFSYENVANGLVNDTAVQALIGYSAIINGAYNKSEIYRDLIIEYYSTYISQDVLEEAILREKRASWYDYLVTLQANLTKYGIQSYDFTKNINILINCINGSLEFDTNFTNQVTWLIQEVDDLSKEATALRAEVYGNAYLKEYIDVRNLNGNVNNAIKALDSLSLGVTVVSYEIDISDTISSLSVVNANNQIFIYNMDALNRLFIYSDDSSVCAAALSIKKLITEQNYDALIEAIGEDVAESALDLTLRIAARESGYVAVVLAVRDMASLAINSKSDIIESYRIICYGEMGDAYIIPFDSILKQTSVSQYYWTFDTTVNTTLDCLSNLSQIRVLGEREYYEYVKNDGLLSYFINSINGLSDVKDNVNNSILNIKEKMDSLKLPVSSRIVYLVA